MADSTLPVVQGAIRQQSQAKEAVIAQTRRPRRDRPFRVATYAFLSVMAIIYIAPFVWMISKSVMDKFEANTTSIIPSQLHIDNYQTVLITANFGQYFFNTVRLEFLTIIGQTVIALLAAYAFARMTFPGRDILFGIFLLTIFVPDTVLLVPNLINVTNISHAFEAVNPSFKWIDNWPGLVIPYLSNTFSIFLLRQFFRQIPDELYDAARIDGAGHLRFLFQIVVPISRAAVLTTILFSFVGVWSALQWPLLVTSSNDWRPIAVALQQYRASDAGAETELLMAASVVALLPVLILYFFAQRQFTEGIATTGLKG